MAPSVPTSVAVHPIVLLGVVDHYNRSCKGSKRYVLVLHVCVVRTRVPLKSGWHAVRMAGPAVCCSCCCVVGVPSAYGR